MLFAILCKCWYLTWKRPFYFLKYKHSIYFLKLVLPVLHKDVLKVLNPIVFPGSRKVSTYDYRILPRNWISPEHPIPQNNIFFLATPVYYSVISCSYLHLMLFHVLIWPPCQNIGDSLDTEHRSSPILSLDLSKFSRSILP